jgi:hypothetical protein
MSSIPADLWARSIFAKMIRAKFISFKKNVGDA